MSSTNSHNIVSQSPLKAAKATGDPTAGSGTATNTPPRTGAGAGAADIDATSNAKPTTNNHSMNGSRANSVTSNISNAGSPVNAGTPAGKFESAANTAKKSKSADVNNADSTSNSNGNSNSNETDSSPTDPTYPEQHHAGKIGYGPNYRMDPTLGEKMTGLAEEIRGKVTRKPERVAHGRDVRTGESHRKQLFGADEKSPFEGAGEDGGKKDSKEEESSDTQSEAQKPDSSSLKGDKGSQQARDVHASPSGMGHEGNEQAAKEQAATVAPEGTNNAEMQRKNGGGGGDVKMVDE